MSVSTVRLLRNCKPVFSPECVVCHGNPDAVYKVTSTSLLWQVKVPICHRCKTPFRWQRWGRQALWLAAIFGPPSVSRFFSNLWPHLGEFPRFITIIAPLLALYLFECFRPRSFDLTFGAGISRGWVVIHYRFASKAYAEVFAKLNGGKLDEEPGGCRG